MVDCKKYISKPSGFEHDLRSPDVARIRITDVAFHLAGIQRWNGGCVRSYSVAEHSIRVACAVAKTEPWNAYAALLHDAHKAYVGDLTAPLLEAVPEVDALSVLWAGACDEAFGVTPVERCSSNIKGCDLSVRRDELECLIDNPFRYRVAFDVGFQRSMYRWRLGSIIPESMSRVEWSNLFLRCYDIFMESRHGV